MTSLQGRLRAAAWLGWQIESNWADLFTFAVYSMLRPLGTALILAGRFWAVTGQITQPGMFAAFYIGNAFHEYVVRVLVGMGWVIVEEREEYETLKYVYASPLGMLTYLWGRSVTKVLLASISVVGVSTTRAYSANGRAHATSTSLPSSPPFSIRTFASRAASSGIRSAMRGVIFRSASSFMSFGRSCRNGPGSFR